MEKEIQGYENRYSITETGVIYSLSKRKRMTTRMDSGNRYSVIDLRNHEGIKLTHRVHRLVAKTFLANDRNLEQVNHINGVKTDNRVENLEWCSRSDNALHSYNVLGHNPKKGKVGAESVKHRKIIQLDLNGNELRTFYGAMEVHRELGIDQSSVHKCCKGQIKTFHGFKWKYA